METLTINIPKEVEVKTVKAVLKALGVTIGKRSSTTRKEKKEKPYNPEYVEKILESRKQAEEGKTVKISLDEIWK